MPRYFFHLDEGSRDLEGTEFDDIAKAKCGAVITAGRMICDEAHSFWEKKEWGMTVTHANDLTLFNLTFFATEAAAVGPSIPLSA